MALMSRQPGRHNASPRTKFLWLPWSVRFVLGVVVAGLYMLAQGFYLATSSGLVAKTGGVILALAGAALLILLVASAVWTWRARRDGSS